MDIKQSDHLLVLENHQSTKSIPKIILPFDSVVYFSSGSQINAQNIKLDKDLFERITDGKVDQN